MNRITEEAGKVIPLRVREPPPRGKHTAYGSDSEHNCQLRRGHAGSSRLDVAEALEAVCCAVSQQVLHLCSHS
jgi:hypothetical protein